MAAAFDAMAMEQRALAMLHILLKHQNSADDQGRPAGMKVSEIINRLFEITGRNFLAQEVDRLVVQVNRWGSEVNVRLVEVVPARRPKQYALNRGLRPEIWGDLATLAFAMSLVRYAKDHIRSGQPDPALNFQNMVLLLFGLKGGKHLHIRYEEEGDQKTTLFRPESVEVRGGWFIVGKTRTREESKEIALRKIRLVERNRS